MFLLKFHTSVFLGDNKTTYHTIASRPDHKQWIMMHFSDLIMIMIIMKNTNIRTIIPGKISQMILILGNVLTNDYDFGP